MSKADAVPLTRMVCTSWEPETYAYLETLEVTGERKPDLPTALPTSWPLGPPVTLLADVSATNRHPVTVEEPSGLSIIIAVFVILVLGLGISSYFSRRGP